MSLKEFSKEIGVGVRNLRDFVNDRNVKCGTGIYNFRRMCCLEDKLIIDAIVERTKKRVLLMRDMRTIGERNKDIRNGVISDV